MNILINLALALAYALCSGSLAPPRWKMHTCGVKGCVGATRRRASTPGEAEEAEITQQDQDLLLCVRNSSNCQRTSIFSRHGDFVALENGYLKSS